MENRELIERLVKKNNKNSKLTLSIPDIGVSYIDSDKLAYTIGNSIEISIATYEEFIDWILPKVK